MILMILLLSCAMGATVTVLFYAATWVKEYRLRRRHRIIDTHYQRLTVMAVLLLLQPVVFYARPVAADTAYLVVVTVNHPYHVYPHRLFSAAAVDSLVANRMGDVMPCFNCSALLRRSHLFEVRCTNWAVYIEQKRVITRRNGKKVLRKIR